MKVKIWRPTHFRQQILLIKVNSDLFWILMKMELLFGSFINENTHNRIENLKEYIYWETIHILDSLHLGFLQKLDNWLEQGLIELCSFKTGSIVYHYEFPISVYLICQWSCSF
jgi:hypothetical protein